MLYIHILVFLELGILWDIMCVYSVINFFQLMALVAVTSF